MTKQTFETIVGAFTLSLVAVLLLFAYKDLPKNASNSYTVVADFTRVDGLKEGHEIRLGGIKVGQVSKLYVNPKSLMARAHFSLDQKIPVPADSSASIVSESLMGGKYVDLVPGGSPENLKSNSRIEHTQSSVSLEKMISKMIFSSGK